MMAIEIENNIKYSLTSSYFSRNVCWQDEAQRKNLCHKGYLILDQLIGTLVVVSNLVESLEVKTCITEDSLLQKGANSLIVKNSAYVGNIIVVEHKVSSLDELYIQDVSSTIPSSIGHFLYDENILK